MSPVLDRRTPRMHLWALACVPALWGGGAFAADPQHPVDAVLARENVGRNVRSTPPVDDLAFLRRVSVT